MDIFARASPWQRNHAGPRVLLQRRGVLSDDNLKRAVFLFILLLLSIFSAVDQFPNLGETTVFYN